MGRRRSAHFEGKRRGLRVYSTTGNEGSRYKAMCLIDLYSLRTSFFLYYSKFDPEKRRIFL